MGSSLRLWVGAGCFWKVQAAFEYLHGISRTEVGYLAVPFDGEPIEASDALAVPPAWQVEVVELEWDERRLPLRRLMEVFWRIHTPTLVPADAFSDSSAYRSLWVCPDPVWRQRFQEEVDRQAQALGAPLQTRVWGQGHFKPAPPSDQHYYRAHPQVAYCRSHVIPCLDRLWHLMPDQFDLEVSAHLNE